MAANVSATESRVSAFMTWASFALMAGISIPHLTVYFRTWEPVTGNAVLDIGCWAVSFIFAASIDCFIILVTRSLLIRRQRRKKLQAKGVKIHWWEQDFKLKISLAGSIVLSFLINWWYSNMQAPDAAKTMGAVYSATTLFIPNSVFMPFICSCAPLLVFVLPEIAEAMRDGAVLNDQEFEAVSPEEHQKRLTAIKQQQDIRDAMQSGPSLLEQAREKIGLNKEKEDHTEAIALLAQKAVEWLKDKPILLQPGQQKEAIKLLDRYLECGKKDAELVLIESLSLIQKQRQNAQQNAAKPVEQEPQTPLQNVPADQLDKLEITMQLLRDYPEITDEELAPRLNLTRPASARFWRLKAQEILATKTNREAYAPSSAPDVDGEYDTRKNEAINAANNSPKNAQVPEVKGVETSVVNAVVKRFPKIVSWLSTREPSVDRGELAQTCAIPHQAITAAIGNRSLKATPNNKRLLTKTSVILWLNSLPTEKVNDPQSAPAEEGNREEATEDERELIGASSGD